MSELDRYSRQILVPEIGAAGQEKLLASSVAVVGCGALGTVIASTLVRAGVGRVRIIDRDFIELNNLQRQVLFDEEDIAKGLPKAVAAVEKLRKANSQVVLEPVVVDVNADNVEALIRDMTLVLDGTDNFEARFLINDACVKNGVPWVYGAVLATYGMAMAIIPHRTPCFRCFLAGIPTPGSVATCDTAGVLGPAVNIVASLEVAEGFKILVGGEDIRHGRLLYVDVWARTMESMQVERREGQCPACDLGQFEFLDATEGSFVTSLCGRDAVQIGVRGAVQTSFPDLAKRLGSVGQVAFNDYLLRFTVDPYELTLFPDGRAIIKGTADESMARTPYAKYVGL